MSEWISVKDRLPPIGVNVLLTGWNYGRQEERHYLCGSVDENGVIWYYDADENKQVAAYITHWQPLLEPPKGAA